MPMRVQEVDARVWPIVPEPVRMACIRAAAIKGLIIILVPVASFTMVGPALLRAVTPRALAVPIGPFKRIDRVSG